MQSVQRLATGWTVRGSNPGGGGVFRNVQTGPGAQPAPSTISNGSFPAPKSGRGVTLTPHHLLVAWSRRSRGILLLKEQRYISTPPMGRTACTEPQCLYKGALYINSKCHPLELFCNCRLPQSIPYTIRRHRTFMDYPPIPNLTLQLIVKYYKCKSSILL